MLRKLGTTGLTVATLLIASTSAAFAARPDRAAELAWADRLTWGVNASTVRAIAADGVDRFLDGQLHPRDDRLPAEAQAQVDALKISREPMAQLVAEMDAQAKALNTIADPDQKKAAQQAYQQAMNDLGRQAATRAILRDLYSPAQLKEQMTWFWMNHFNVQQYKSNIRATLADYEETAVRPRALGRFRDLLGATLRHPAMLRYLDNDQNAAGHINENYARELMELHTLGVGSGYSQKDVEELARILTGVGVNQTPNTPKLKPELQSQYVRDGLFEFNPARHDFGDKLFLGRHIKGRGLAEVDEALDILSREPATAKFVTGKLAVYFTGSAPSPALADRLAKSFRKSDGDIAAVLKTLFQSPEFKASLGSQFKDPVHYAISAVRLAYDDKVILNTAPLQGWLGRMAEPLYAKETPDGYPLTEAAWSGPGALSTRFEIARQIGSGSAGLFKTEGPSATERPAFPLLQNALYFEGLSQRLGDGVRKTLDQASSPQDWNTLFLSSPDFMRR
jgi:uncharacterized protein (DUF1800 family)